MQSDLIPVLERTIAWYEHQIANFGAKRRDTKLMTLQLQGLKTLLKALHGKDLAAALYHVHHLQYFGNEAERALSQLPACLAFAIAGIPVGEGNPWYGTYV